MRLRVEEKKLSGMNGFKKVVGALAAGALVAACALPVAAIAPQEAQAASKPYMKTLKLKWDLKKNKAGTIKETWVGIGKQACSYKVKNFKTVKASKKGYKKTTFTISFTRGYILTKKQVHKIVKHPTYQGNYGEMGADKYFAVVDYNTGKSLEGKNDLGVKVKSTWKNSGFKKVTDSDGCWIRASKYSNVKVSITYPNTYKELCLGIGGNNLVISDNMNDNKFWDGNATFGKTSFYKNGKSNSHWMRIK